VRNNGWQLALVAVVLAFPGCTAARWASAGLTTPNGYTSELHPAIWALERVSADGAAAWIWDAEGGCAAYDHSRVKATSHGLRITVENRVLIPTSPHTGCLLNLRPTRHRVALPRPLGNGEIAGACRPGDATPRQRICALMHIAARRAPAERRSAAALPGVATIPPPCSRKPPWETGCAS
jgi:hypothetical protein